MARVRILHKTDAGVWTIPQLGGLAVAASGGTLDIADIISDAELIDAIQNNGLTFSATAYLETEVENITTQYATFGNVAHLDFSASGGNNKVPLLDASGNLILGGGHMETTETSFSGNEVPNATWIENLVAGASFKGCAVSPFFKGDADIEPVGPTPGDSYIVGTIWGGFAIGDIVERNQADDGWDLVDAAAIGDQLIVVAASPVGDFIGATVNSLIKLTSITGPFTYDLVSTASDGMYSIVCGAGSAYNNNLAIYDDTAKWTTHELVTSIIAGVGLLKTGTTLSIGSHTADDIVNGIKFLADDIELALTTAAGAQAFGGLQINSGTGALEALTDNDSLEVNASNQLALKKVTVTLGQRFVLSFGDDGNVKNQALYHSGVRTSDAGPNQFRACKVVSVSCQLSASGTCDVHLKKRTTLGGGWSTLLDDAVQLAAADRNSATGLSSALAAGEELRVDIENASNVRNPIVEVELEWTA